DVLRKLRPHKGLLLRGWREGFDLLNRVRRRVLPWDKRKDVGAIELLPDLIEGFGEVFFDPRFWLLGKLERGGDTMLVEQRRRLRPNAPDVAYGDLGKVVMELPARDRRES